MIKFFDSSCEVTFIKSLLYNTYLPIYDTVDVGSYIVKGYIYVFETSLIRCNKSGYIGGYAYPEEEYSLIEGITSEYLVSVVASSCKDDLEKMCALADVDIEDLTVYDADAVYKFRNTTEVSSSRTRAALKVIYKVTHSDTEKMYELASYDVIAPYKWNTHYMKYSDNFVSNSNIYDEATHNRLAKYLRCYRDIIGVNLLPYLNLYTNNYLLTSKLLYLEDEKTGISSMVLRDYYDSGFNQLKIPIKFNTDYTIALDCNSEIILAPAFFANEIRLVVKAEKAENDRDITDEFNAIRYTDKYTSEEKTFAKIIQSTDFKNPIVYRVDITSLDEEDLLEYYKYKENLYLLIQVPEKLQSSIVVLEGDYSNQDIFYSGTKVSDIVEATGYGYVNKGYVDTVSNLPLTGNTYGDVYTCKDTMHRWCWMSEFWAKYFTASDSSITITSDSWVDVNKFGVETVKNDYITSTEHIISLEYNEEDDILGIHGLHDPEMNKVCQSPLTLIQFGAESNFLNSDRLMEYLLENIIDANDSLDNNIELLQSLLPNIAYNDYTEGVWNNTFRYKLYLYSLSFKNTRGLDFNGYIDKDTEKALLSLQQKT